MGFLYLERLPLRSLKKMKEHSLICLLKAYRKTCRRKRIDGIIITAISRDFPEHRWL